MFGAKIKKQYFSPYAKTPKHFKLLKNSLKQKRFSKIIEILKFFKKIYGIFKVHFLKILNY